MSTSAIIYLERRDSVHGWEHYTVYSKDGEPYPLWEGVGPIRDELVNNKYDNYGNHIGIDYIDMKRDYEHIDDTDNIKPYDDFDRLSDYVWNEYKASGCPMLENIIMTYAQLCKYLEHHPRIIDYDESYEDSDGNFHEVYIDHPLKDVLQLIHAVIDIRDDYWDCHWNILNDFRIVMWIV